ncbi:hypothetical protein PV729_12620 [Streptomyces europaeiscabiei]|uniref:Transposase n=1 Tax=Streptomyces europaeiscabiei TaxID=146819 RepID=A0ABU4NSZ5_9ACTN|nr:hypothetical protein [Streptomyces europaeiscabiei]MDX3548398.1 hypothetical protein [Streptomyces europaeiscabiei]MDX3552592.1 hypothetical protein [Streptomyces europaeiscabiei]MDX3705953.1 hypothetical protein [Streptomyces europaeiscabiei]
MPMVESSRTTRVPESAAGEPPAAVAAAAAPGDAAAESRVAGELPEPCANVRQAGVDIGPHLREVAELSRRGNKSGKGSTPDILCSAAQRGDGPVTLRPLSHNRE